MSDKGSVAILKEKEKKEREEQKLQEKQLRLAAAKERAEKNEKLETLRNKWRNSIRQEIEAKKDVGKVKPVPPKPKSKKAQPKKAPIKKTPQQRNKVAPSSVLSKPEPLKIVGKPRILILSDVTGWAWWIKSHYLKKYLSDEFVIDVIPLLEKRNYDKNSYHLYFTFGYSFVGHLSGVPLERRCTGVTAHRPKSSIVPAMKKAKWIHANSILLRDELKRWGVKNVYYVPNGVDTNLFRPVPELRDKKEDSFIAGHIGKLSASKGQTTIIKPAIRKSKAKSYMHLNNYTNKIPHTEMYKKYQQMDVMLVASIEDGTPNPALEAMACGVPVISNRIGNMPEAIKDGYNGFIVDKKVEEYVKKINYLVDNPNIVKEMGENARKTMVESWTWEIQAENYRKMFREALGIKK